MNVPVWALPSVRLPLLRSMTGVGYETIPELITPPGGDQFRTRAYSFTEMPRGVSRSVTGMPSTASYGVIRTTDGKLVAGDQRGARYPQREGSGAVGEGRVRRRVNGSVA
ncbi:hypothetical protein GCM10017776_40960 [Streptomyces griseoluteus]|nr:hypothetical protein GCM10017776_40960 [Streptomyces griseoluteus]